MVITYMYCNCIGLYILCMRIGGLRKVAINHYVEGYFSEVCVEGGNYPRGTSASRLGRNKIPKATPCFGVKHFNIAISNTSRRNRKS